MISKSCKYAIRATLFIASRMPEGRKINVTEVAKEIDAPEAFTAKIMQTLARHKVITSLKGPYGGFYMRTEQAELPLIHIINAIDGLSVFNECGMGLKQCSEKHPCPLHNDYKIVRNRMQKMFSDIRIRQLAGMVRKGSGHLTS